MVSLQDLTELSLFSVVAGGRASGLITHCETIGLQTDNCFVQHNALRQVVASQIPSSAERTDWHLSSIGQPHNALHWFLSGWLRSLRLSALDPLRFVLVAA